MKTKIILAAILFITGIGCRAQEHRFVGMWSGKIAFGSHGVSIGLHIYDSSGKTTGYFMSPDQGIMYIQIDRILMKSDSIRCKASGISAMFKACLNSTADTLKGIWKQGGSYSLNMARTDSLPVLNRPQEPRDPFPYTSEEVSFDNKEAGIILRGTLSLPDTGTNLAAVVLVSGSGPQNRDEEILGHKPFLVIADHLTRRGIVVLRYDDRGTGASGGNFAAATTADLAGDAASAFLFLRSHPRVNPQKTGIIGHSEGGMIAPIVAGQYPAGFIVMLAGPGIPGKDLLLLQAKLIARADSVPEAEIERNTRLNEALYRIVMHEPDNRKAGIKIRRILDKYWKRLPEEEIRKMNLDRSSLSQVAYQITTPWFRYFLQADPGFWLRKVQCPVLALNGSYDLQVPAEENTEAIRKNLVRAKNPNFTIKIIPGLNHLFQHALSGSPTEYIEIEETFDPETLDIVGSWILSLP